VVTIVTNDQRRMVRRMTDRAGVRAESTVVRPGDAELSRITGAQQPSGEPVAELRREAPPRRGGSGGYRGGQGGGGGYQGSREGGGGYQGSREGGREGGRPSFGGRSRQPRFGSGGTGAGGGTGRPSRGPRRSFDS
jgi:hypothetical protein